MRFTIIGNPFTFFNTEGVCPRHHSNNSTHTPSLTHYIYIKWFADMGIRSTVWTTNLRLSMASLHTLECRVGTDPNRLAHGGRPSLDPLPSFS